GLKAVLESGRRRAILQEDAMTRQLRLAALAGIAALLGASPAPAFAQAKGLTAHPYEKPAHPGDRIAASFKTPRLADGQPDLQGVWSNASNTTMSRPAKFSSLVMSDAENAKAVAENPANVRQATDDNQKLSDGLLTGKDLAQGRGYNAFWIDPGTAYANV